ncbi:TIGR03619 family F420-dependent LLM class oxidoreductase [Nocardia sp. NPDC058633]|uniref:TIGR03619 family F420-dependent LLM class oxidoreductase n=1 Tax=Nocardia sp. NPDC058633 TaxID=3346568 RepID=UPI00364F32DB
MKFYISTAYLPVEEIIPIAQAADALGYHGMAIPDHLINLAEISTPYPYTSDGQRRWPPHTPWPDPWVLAGALATVTQNLRFVTTVYVAPLRDPFTVAKVVGTAALISGGRVELGLGVGWCKDEFDVFGAQFTGRGRRTDEMITVLRRLWQPGWTEFEGTYYQFPRLEMSPTPPPIPILVGGLSDAALARAARNDGWIGDLMTTAEAIDTATRLHRLRHEQGRDTTDFTVIAPLTDAFTPDQFQRAADAGVTHTLTMPWMYYSGPDAGIAEKIAGLEKFHGQFLPAA